MSELLPAQPVPPPCPECGSERHRPSVIRGNFFCIDCGALLNPSPRTDDPRQMDMLP